MEYLIDDRVLILSGKGYTPNFTDKNYYCFDYIDCQDVFNWSTIFNKTRDAFVYLKYQLDANHNPKNYIFLAANDKYEQITSYKKEDIIGKKITEIMEHKKDASQELIKKFYKTALCGEEQNFSLSSKLTGKNYSVFVYSPYKNFFAMIFKLTPDISDIQTDYLQDYKKVADILNLVYDSQSVITELENPYESKNTRKLGMVSCDVAKYLGIIDKNIKLKKSTLATGLKKIILPPEKQMTLKKMESKEVNILCRYEDVSNKIKKNDIYFMTQN
ncbi:MAG: PAS domain S-box protein [Candidatus Humimicrobiaceae bacterium]